MAHRWTPRRGAERLVAELGQDATLACLGRLVAGEISPNELVVEPWDQVLIHVGDGHAARLDIANPLLRYWTRSWAARALAYVGDASSLGWLRRALGDDHWRVRMTAAQSIGRLAEAGLDVTSARRRLALLLDDEHPRVSAAAELALERAGPG